MLSDDIKKFIDESLDKHEGLSIDSLYMEVCKRFEDADVDFMEYCEYSEKAQFLSEHTSDRNLVKLGESIESTLQFLIANKSQEHKDAVMEGRFQRTNRVRTIAGKRVVQRNHMVSSMFKPGTDQKAFQVVGKGSKRKLVPITASRSIANKIRARKSARKAKAKSATKKLKMALTMRKRKSMGFDSKKSAPKAKAGKK